MQVGIGGRSQDRVGVSVSMELSRSSTELHGVSERSSDPFTSSFTELMDLDLNLDLLLLWIYWYITREQI